MSSFEKILDQEIERYTSESKVKGFNYNVSEVQEILKTLKNFSILLKKFNKEGNFNPVILEEYGFINNIFNKNSLEKLLKGEYLIPEKSLYYLLDNVSETCTKALEELQLFIDRSEEEHLKSLKDIDELEENKEYYSLDCFCKKCQSLLRRHNENIFLNLSKNEIIKTKKIIFENNFENIKILECVQDLNKNINSIKNRAKKKFKGARYRKICKEMDRQFLTYFGHQSDVGKKYIKYLTNVFYEQIEEKGIEREAVNTNELTRFFNQLKEGIWKSEEGIKKEFQRLIKSILKLKQEDLSSSILQEYLGKFWLHSDARSMRRKIIYHMGPTNSGKTYNAVKRLCESSSGTYLAPLRLLAGELYDTMTEQGVATTLLTGEEVVETEGATHFSSTVEMAKLKTQFDCCVIDEIQMMGDPQRGWAWTRALVNIQAKEVHLCGDPSVKNLVEKICSLTGDELTFVEYKRLTKLRVLDYPISISEVKKGDAVIVFSRNNALNFKKELEKRSLKASIVYGRLGPEVRREQARKFSEGETDVIVSTDAIAMGMNLPIKRIVFTTLTKFFDMEENPISYSEIKQIAGRAGRYKKFPTGEVTCLKNVYDGIDTIKDAISVELSENERAMLGPDLEIYNMVNGVLEDHELEVLNLSEFLALFNTMTFNHPFYCVDLKEMIELTEVVEYYNRNKKELSTSEIFGFSCAPVNMGMFEHMETFKNILKRYINGQDVDWDRINFNSSNIDYLEKSIKCLELYQWLSRHFNDKNFNYDEEELKENKQSAINKLNELLSERMVNRCFQCGRKMSAETKYKICESCFFRKRKSYKRRRP